jgi:predicted pyridoxine 5'-phosphate oxidase superfamily flavin-nucleotide-binding protein
MSRQNGKSRQAPAPALPGSRGEHELQERLGTAKRAAAFYNKQMLDHVNPLMRQFIARQQMAFVGTSDGGNECDVSFRAGPPGFVKVLDEKTLIYPEYPGNGVMASLGNVSENPHIALLFVDFFDSAVGLHVNGRAAVVEHAGIATSATLERFPNVEDLLDVEDVAARTPGHWIVIDVVEAYIHCSKHIPLLSRVEDPEVDAKVRARGDVFGAKHSPRPWVTCDPGQPVEAETDEAAAPKPAELERRRAVRRKRPAATTPAATAEPAAPKPAELEKKRAARRKPPAATTPAAKTLKSATG